MRVGAVKADERAAVFPSTSPQAAKGLQPGPADPAKSASASQACRAFTLEGPQGLGNARHLPQPTFKPL
jgi:hypothetical protein